jgi:hypothetical protein
MQNDQFCQKVFHRYVKLDKFDNPHKIEHMIIDFQKRKTRIKRSTRVSKFKKFFIQFKSTHSFRLIA